MASDFGKQNYLADKKEEKIKFSLVLSVKSIL